MATLVVAKWTDELDEKRLHAVLNKETGNEADQPEALVTAKTSQMAGGVPKS